MNELPDIPNQPQSWVDRVIKFCLENKLLVALMIIFIAVWGVIVAPFEWKIGFLPRDPVPVDAIPDLGDNQQIVFTEWEGRSAELVENQITKPLTSALLGLPHVKVIRSSSMFGFSTVSVIFEDKAEYYWTRSRILEKLSSLPSGTLPSDVKPTLGPDATPLGQIFWYTLEGRDENGQPTGGWDLQELRSLQDWKVRYELAAVEGVAEVASVGGHLKEYQIDVDPDALRAHQVTIDQIYNAVQMSNMDVGARTIEVNKVAYYIRGLGLLKNRQDIEKTVVKVSEGVPLCVKDVANVVEAPGERFGALDKGGAEAVGGVVVVRYGANPLEVINRVKQKIRKLNDTRLLGKKTFEGRTSYASVVPFYDRTHLIRETLGTLNEALLQELIVNIIVVILMILHFRSSLIISSLMPMTVLATFIGMKYFGVDANVMALAGIAIAVGEVADMGIIMCENILKRLGESKPNESMFSVVYHGATEVGGAVVTSISTIIISFIPVFFMTGENGKLYKPLAYTKTFALVASVIFALTMIPPLAHLLMTRKSAARPRASIFYGFFALAAGALFYILFAVNGGNLWGVQLRDLWWMGAIILGIGIHFLLRAFVPPRLESRLTDGLFLLLAFIIIMVLTKIWMPLGVGKGFFPNLVVTTALSGGLMGFLYVFMKLYGYILKWCLEHKAIFLSLPLVMVLFGIGYVWLGVPAFILMSALLVGLFVMTVIFFGLVLRKSLWYARNIYIVTPLAVLCALGWIGLCLGIGLPRISAPLPNQLTHYQNMKWGTVKNSSANEKARWTIAQDWKGRGEEARPPLDEGTFLSMPVTMPHASISESLDILKKQDVAIQKIPEVESVVGKIGRAESALDPAPISMMETVINYKPEWMIDEYGQRLSFKATVKNVDGKEVVEFERDKNGQLIPDENGKPFRLWGEGVNSAEDIWEKIRAASEVPGATTAPKLQPIAARLVMLQTGIRAPLGLKVTGSDLGEISKAALIIEEILKQIPEVDSGTVFAERLQGTPYLDIVIDRDALKTYGLALSNVQSVIDSAIGGSTATTTLEGRERYPVRIRYFRELRDQIESLGKILVSTPSGAQVPLELLTNLRRPETVYRQGPQEIKGENSMTVSYIGFAPKQGVAEVDSIIACEKYLADALKQMRADKSPKIEMLSKTKYEFFVGGKTVEEYTYDQNLLKLMLVIAILLIFIVLYLEFKSALVTWIVFHSIFVAWAGGFLMLWAYAQPWFMDVNLWGVSIRELFQMHSINMSTAVWVGFLSLFGVATNDAVIITAYLRSSFARHESNSIPHIREAVMEAGLRRIRPCLMTAATTILALLPVLTASGKGGDIMAPMAIPLWGGMVLQLITLFITPILYSLMKEVQFTVKKSLAETRSRV